jgi:phosphonate transport system substrate-binding protein
VARFLQDARQSGPQRATEAAGLDGGGDPETQGPFPMKSVLRKRNRRQAVRQLLRSGLAAAALLAPMVTVRGAAAPLRFGTTPVFLDDQLALLGVWQGYLQGRLGRPVQFFQRGSYREIVDLLLGDRVDAAWLCGYPYVMYEDRMQLVAVARYQGQPLYRSHLVVPATETAVKDVAGLAGRIFAYSDPLSNSGHLVPRVELLRAGHDPDRFFRRSFFTFGHRKVVEAVRAGLAHAGAVDGYVWDTLQAQHPEATAGLRVAWRSGTYGFPPVVARPGLPATEREALTRALVGMPGSAPGAQLLQRLNIDGFEPAPQALFDSIRELVRLHRR